MFAVTAVTAAAGCSPVRAAASRRLVPPDPRATEPYGEQRDPLVLQILAHPDDDLYFMNPDTLHSLQSGTPVVSVYVTAGESTGVNHAPFGPKRHHRHDIAAYSSARHQGLRQAYATMLGLPHFTRWEREVIELPGGLHAEVDSLGNGRGHARLVFLQVSMHELSPGASLPLLWQQPGTALPYVVAEGAPSPANAPAVYTHQSLVDALAALMDRYRPTLIRTLDPDPDIQVHDKKHPINSDQPGYSDHRDHTAAALFAWKAMNQWVTAATRRDAKVPPFTTAAYRGYYNQRWPFNLPPATVALKGRFLFQYGGDVAWPCGNHGGCGDYGQGENQPLTNRKGWVRSTHPRYPVTTPAILDRTAYEVLGTRAVERTETEPGVWGPPRDLGGGPLAPALSCVRGPGGGVLLFALRFAAIEGHGGRNTRDVVLWHNGRWTSLGSPESTDDRSRRIGSPVAVAAADGRVHLFLRNAAKGVSSRVLTQGVWGPWTDLGGHEVQEGLAALADGTGRVHVFAAARDTIHHWSQSAPGARVTLRPRAPWPVPGDIPKARLTADGTIALTYRLPASTHLHGVRLTPTARGTRF